MLSRIKENGGFLRKVCGFSLTACIDENIMELKPSYFVGKEGMRMKISTKGRYAVRVMLDLAQHQQDGNVKVREIAARQGISEKYLEQIIAVLNKAGYVRSIRGAQGGYRIAGQPEKYTVGMILRLTEGKLCPVACLETDENECERCDTCETLSLWQELGQAINQVVDSVTIADLMNRKKEQQS